MIKISVSGKHIKVGDSLRDHVAVKSEEIAKKYLANVTTIEVFFSKHGALFHTDVVMHEGSGLGVIKANAESEDAYIAFDSAIIKIEKQLRRYKRKIKDHYNANSRHEKFDQSYFHGKKYVLSPVEFTEEDGIAEQQHDEQPLTVAESATNIETLTVSEAIMKMDFAHLPALVFRNRVNDRVNFIYYRKDGNISWVDPVGNSKE